MTADGTPRISVVMPSLNQGRFIDEAIRSVLGGHPPDVELYVADGGSTDGTQERLQSLASEFGAALRWSSQRDGGPAEAVNRAIAQSRAPLIGWLNSDDLYAEGAIARALAHFEAAPGHLMVYGEGEHVDVAGAFLERYPTLPPSTPIQVFSEGCFICQPTAFFKRDAFNALGGLDPTLRASFDFDLWLRFFKTYPERIGFVHEVQALSRLHEGGITLSQRGRVAREGITVLGRHLGWAPPNWAITWLEELCAAHPFHPTPLDMTGELEKLAADCAGFLGPAGLDVLQARIDADTRLRLATPELYVDVGADGWAGPELQIRVLRRERRDAELRLLCRHASPARGVLMLEVLAPDGAREEIVVQEPGLFVIEIDLSTIVPGEQAVWRVACEDCFVPAQWERGSNDTRALAFKVEDRELAAPAR